MSWEDPTNNMNAQGELGFWLKKRRRVLDLTQDELAQMVGCSITTIRKIEYGERRPSKQMAARLAVCLSVPPHEQGLFISFARGESQAPAHSNRNAVEGPAPWTTRQRKAINLPTPLTPILGRDREVSRIRDLFIQPDKRLVNLIGPPGIGKTRLSIAIAAAILDTFVDGACFIPLAPINDPELIAVTISQVLGLAEESHRTPENALIGYFRSKQTLLILDNFEHLLSAAPLVVNLLQECDQLKILVTSRSALHIRGEIQFPVNPLALPELTNHPNINDLLAYPAVALFVSRAQAENMDFSINEQNAPAVIGICAQLEGLPLALELAAAWIKLLSPQEILERLSHRLDFLTGGQIDLPPRQRTLRAAINWSYELLDAREKLLMSCMGVFVGGFTFEAGRTVLAKNETKDQINRYQGFAINEFEVLDGLASLVSKSLLSKQEYPDGHTRFTMLETIREFALEKLNSSGNADIIIQRHAHYYLQLAVESEPALRGPEQEIWLKRLKHEHNNFRCALQWGLSHYAADFMLKLAGSLWRYWWMHGHFSEGRGWLEKSLALPDPHSLKWQSKALNGAGILARGQGDYASAREYLEASLDMQEALQDWKGVANALNSLGVLAQFQADYDLAYQYHERSLDQRRKLGDQRGTAVSLNNLAMVAHERKDFSKARELYVEGLSLFERLGDSRGAAAALGNLGSVHLDQQDPESAFDFFRKSLAILRELEQRSDIIEALEGLAGVAALNQQPKHAARLIGAAEELRQSIGVPVPPFNQNRYREIVHNIEVQLDSKSLALEKTKGRKMSMDQAIQYALEQS